MELPSTWGDGTMIEIAMKFYKRPILLYYLQSDLNDNCRPSIFSYPGLTADAKPIFLGYTETTKFQGKNHYVSLIPKSGIQIVSASLEYTFHDINQSKENCKSNQPTSSNDIEQCDSNHQISSKSSIRCESNDQLLQKQCDSNHQISSKSSIRCESNHQFLQKGNNITYDIGDFIGIVIDDLTKCQILENPWIPPSNYKFPYSIHMKKGKNEKRYLNQSHLDKYQWVTFSESKQGLFCKYCPFFQTSKQGGFQGTVPLKQLVTTPLKSFAKLLGKDGTLEIHSQNIYHLKAIEAAKDFLKVFHCPKIDVRNQVHNQRYQQVQENIERLKPIVKSILFMGRQNIPLRGHRDDGSLFNLSPNPVNEGNFREILRFRIDAGDNLLENHLKTTGANATYISKTIQNQLIECCREEIVSKIIGNVKKAKFFSVLFDETTDISHTSQMSIVLRYVVDNVIREDFIGFLDCRKENVSAVDGENVEPILSGKVLGETVLGELKKFDLNMNYCVGIGTDGCSVMVSKQKGAIVEIQKTAINAIRCPCFNHALNLSLSKSSDVSFIRNVIGVMREIISFSTSSSKRNFVFKNILKGQLSGLCETRWVERHDSVIQFKAHLDKIIEALNVISCWEDNDSSCKAESLISSISRTEFIISLFSLADILSITISLSKIFQSSTLDVVTAWASFNDAMTVLQLRRENCEEHFKDVYEEVKNVMKTLDIIESFPRMNKYQKNRPNPPSNNSEEYYRKALYNPLLDSILLDCKDRFKPEIKNALSIHFLMPENIIDSNKYSKLFENIDNLVSQYENVLNDNKNVVKSKLKGEVELWKIKWSNSKKKNHCLKTPYQF